MAYFTFDKTNRPIATIKGGKDNGRLVFLGEESEDAKKDTCCGGCMSGCGITSPYCCKKCKTTGGCLNDELMEGGSEYDRIFGKEIKKVQKGQLPYINLNEGVMVPIPRVVKNDELKRENIFVSAPEEAGKSTWAANYISVYRKMYPKSKFFIFSGVDKDAPLDNLNPIRIKLDHKIVENPLQPDEFPDRSIILFDDINGLSDRTIQKEVQALRDRLLEKGRHKALFILSLNHNPTAGKETKASLMEASSIVLFPKGGDTFHIDKVLKTYLGYKPQVARDVMKLNTRWIQCHKRYPQFILHEKGCFFPN